MSRLWSKIRHSLPRRSRSRATGGGWVGGRAPALPVLLLLLLGLAGCGPVVGLRLPGGPMRGSMTYDEAVGARDGLTSVDRLPEAGGRR